MVVVVVAVVVVVVGGLVGGSGRGGAGKRAWAKEGDGREGVGKRGGERGKMRKIGCLYRRLSSPQGCQCTPVAAGFGVWTPTHAARVGGPFNPIPLNPTPLNP